VEFENRVLTDSLSIDLEIPLHKAMYKGPYTSYIAAKQARYAARPIISHNGPANNFTRAALPRPTSSLPLHLQYRREKTAGLFPPASYTSGVTSTSVSV
jgi:hypothetical protein